MLRTIALIAGVVLLTVTSAQTVSAQVFGIELHNTTMPASGGMAGTSLSQPQDVTSAINGNPATTTLFPGTQFIFGGAFVEPTYNVNQTAALPLIGVTPFSGKSATPASLLGNIGVTHQTEVMGIPLTLGMGFISNAGLGVDFRQFPESNGTHASYLALDVVNSVGIQVSPQLSFGTSIAIGTSILDGPFASSSSSQIAYSPRFSVGSNYDFGNGRSIGVYWQSKKWLTFDNIVRFPGGSFQDINLEHPSNFGIGIANQSLMCGRLLLAADFLFKNYSDADFFKAIYENQWVFQFGSQYQINEKLKFRMGYYFNEDPTRDAVPGTIGGIVPVGGIPSVQYVQGQFASVTQHSLSGGFGVRELLPGMDFDLSLGGAFQGEKSFGDTTASVESYWIAFGFSYRRGATTPHSSEVSNFSIPADGQ